MRREDRKGQEGREEGRCERVNEGEREQLWFQHLNIYGQLAFWVSLPADFFVKHLVSLLMSVPVKQSWMQQQWRL